MKFAVLERDDGSITAAYLDPATGSKEELLQEFEGEEFKVLCAIELPPDECITYQNSVRLFEALFNLGDPNADNPSLLVERLIGLGFEAGKRAGSLRRVI